MKMHRTGQNSKKSQMAITLIHIHWRVRNIVSTWDNVNICTASFSPLNPPIYPFFQFFIVWMWIVNKRCEQKRAFANRIREFIPQMWIPVRKLGEKEEESIGKQVIRTKYAYNVLYSVSLCRNRRTEYLFCVDGIRDIFRVYSNTLYTELSKICKTQNHQLRLYPNT